MNLKDAFPRPTPEQTEAVLRKVLSVTPSEARPWYREVWKVAAVIAGKRVNLTIDEARALAKRALAFKNERARLPSITSPDAWERRMAEGVAFLARMKAETARG